MCSGVFLCSNFAAEAAIQELLQSLLSLIAIAAKVRGLLRVHVKLKIIMKNRNIRMQYL